MNDLEKKFEAALESSGICEYETQKRIGIYVVDFYIDGIVVEIDGHEYHKTKEQREHDYIRERYLQKRGFTVVRFTGTEVYLDPDQCIEELAEIIDAMSQRLENAHFDGWTSGRNQAADNLNIAWIDSIEEIRAADTSDYKEVASIIRKHIVSLDERLRGMGNAESNTIQLASAQPESQHA